uniref:Uncharacterized protein n=1 Tax=Anopheles culicifacies TaxID=139723 RepID=A0A182LWN2_9DIPT
MTREALEGHFLRPSDKSTLLRRSGDKIVQRATQHTTYKNCGTEQYGQCGIDRFISSLYRTRMFLEPDAQDERKEERYAQYVEIACRSQIHVLQRCQPERRDHTKHDAKDASDNRVRYHDEGRSELVQHTLQYHDQSGPLYNASTAYLRDTDCSNILTERVGSIAGTPQSGQYCAEALDSNASLIDSTVQAITPASIPNTPANETVGIPNWPGYGMRNHSASSSTRNRTSVRAGCPSGKTPVTVSTPHTVHMIAIPTPGNCTSDITWENSVNIAVVPTAIPHCLEAVSLACWKSVMPTSATVGTIVSGVTIRNTFPTSPLKPSTTCDSAATAIAPESSRIRTCQSSVRSDSVIAFITSTAGHFHCGRLRMASVGTRKEIVPPCTIGNRQPQVA